MKTRLGDIITTLTDYHANGSYEALKKHVDLLDEPDYALMIRTTNFEQNDFDRVNKYISKDAYDYMAKSKVYPYDIIMNKIANAGSVYLAPNLNRPISLAMNLFLIRIDKTKANPIYVFNHLKLFEPYIKQFANGTAAVTITKDSVRNLKFDFPLLAIQHKIASILSAYDDLIENNKQRIKLLEEMAEEIYKEWFVRLRFPGYETARFFGEDGIEVQVGVVGALPEGWKKVKLRDCLANYIGGGWGEEKPSGKISEPAFVIRGTDIPDARAGILNIEALRYHSLSNLSSRKLQSNDIVFEVSGGTETQSLGRTLFISKSLLERIDNDVICASFCKLIRTKSDLALGLFVYYLLNRLYKTGEIMLYQVQSTGISNYKFEDFIENQRILLPPIQIQQDFVGIAQPMYDDIQLLGSKNLLLQQTRDLLLPRLISGKLSVEHLLEKVD